MWYVICAVHGKIGFRKDMKKAEKLINNHHIESGGNCWISLFDFAVEPSDNEIEYCQKKLGAFSNKQHRDLT